jgi:hypothetical protein
MLIDSRLLIKQLIELSGDFVPLDKDYFFSYFDKNTTEEEKSLVKEFIKSFYREVYSEDLKYLKSLRDFGSDQEPFEPTRLHPGKPSGRF